MPVLTMPWRARMALFLSDRGVRRRARRFLVAITGTVVVRAAGRLCIHLPAELGESCHEAAVLMGRVARAVVFVLGAG